MIMAIAIEGIKPYKSKKGEKYMNKAMLEHFREVLEMQKQALMEKVDLTKDHMRVDAANFPDPNDRATQEEEFNFELRTRDRERKLIAKIEEVLDAVDARTYGFCEACGEEIGLRRLDVRPTAILCVDCKNLDEIREKQQGS